jgi:hypothetical protein
MWRDGGRRRCRRRQRRSPGGSCRWRRRAAGAGQVPAAGGGQGRRLRGLAGPGPGARGGIAPVGDRAVRARRAGGVRRGAAHAAHELAVHCPPGGAAAIPGRRAAAPGAGQGAVHCRGDQRLPRAGGRAAHGGAADAHDGAGLPRGGRRADPRRPARCPGPGRDRAVRRPRRGRPRPAGTGGARPFPLPRPAAGRGPVRRDRADLRRRRSGPPEPDEPADHRAGRRDRAAPPGYIPAAGDVAAGLRGPARPATAFMHAAGITCSQRLGDLVAGLEPASEAGAVTLLGATRRR